jgi:hypothetical protein
MTRITDLFYLFITVINVKVGTEVENKIYS